MQNAEEFEFFERFIDLSILCVYPVSSRNRPMHYTKWSKTFLPLDKYRKLKYDSEEHFPESEVALLRFTVVVCCLCSPETKKVTTLRINTRLLAGLYLSNFIRGVEVLAIEVCAHCQCTVHTIIV